MVYLISMPWRAPILYSRKTDWLLTAATMRLNTLRSTIFEMSPGISIVGWSPAYSGKSKSASARALESHRKEESVRIMSTVINEVSKSQSVTDERELLELESKYCSWGD